MATLRRPAPSADHPRTAAGPGRPKDLHKREAILQAACTLFLDQGYAGTSMDAVAAAAGVSKLTVYSHFGDKDGLFHAAVRHTCSALLPDALFAPDRQAPLAAQLHQIGLAFYALVNSPEGLATQRVMLDPATDPHLRQLVWEAGPQRMAAALEAVLRHHAAAGTLQLEDPALAARHFFCLVRGEPAAPGPAVPVPGSGAATRHVAAAVDFFLRACAPR